MRILNMKTQVALRIFLIMLVLLLFVESKTTDLYKVLGVDSKASQREIQKAFHKLSLQYHPDKNKAKDAQEKFAEINNAYDILSNEEKRKNYDLYGGEKRAPRYDTGGAGDHGGYTYFTNSGPGESGGGSRSFSFSFGGPRSSRSSFNFGSDDMEEGAPGFDTGGAGDHGGYTYFMNSGPGESGGGSRSFSFSFGGPSSSRSSSNFGSDDIFSNIFGGNTMGGSQFGGFGSSGRSRSGGTRNFFQKIPAVNAQVFRKEVAEKGITWLLLFYTSAFSLTGMESYEYLIGETTTSLEGALKVGRINCEIETFFCEELGVYPGYEPKIFVYSYRSSEGGSLVEYNGEFDKKRLKTFCREHLPKFSKRVNLGRFYYESVTIGDLPKVLLLSTKKDTPVIWRTLSGLYRKQFAFYDAEVHDVSDPTMKRLGVDSLPAIVGWLSNGEKHTIKAGISVKDLKSAVQDLSRLLENFEKLNKAASARSKKMESGSKDGRISLLAGSNFDDICGEKVPVCIIGVFRSPKGKDELENIFLWVSEKSLLTRRQNAASGLKDSVSYALLDAAKQRSFLTAFDKTSFKSADKLLLAYKPRKGKFATSWGEITVEKAEDFIGSVLNGDVHFSKTQKRPILK